MKLKRNKKTQSHVGKKLFLAQSLPPEREKAFFQHSYISIILKFH